MEGLIVVNLILTLILALTQFRAATKKTDHGTLEISKVALQIAQASEISINQSGKLAQQTSLHAAEMDIQFEELKRRHENVLTECNENRVKIKTLTDEVGVLRANLIASIAAQNECLRLTHAQEFLITSLREQLQELISNDDKSSR